MPHRVLPLVATVIALPSLFAGCARTANTGAESGARPQALLHRIESNRFAGDWGPGPEYLANNWIVRFAKDGRISVSGPGMTARGVYVASGSVARAAYDIRDGGMRDPKLMHGDFSVSSDGRELTFMTGLPNDGPVHLRRL